jgi:hypothetical protein
MRPIHVWRSRTPDGIRCGHFPSVITTIMDYKVQLINPLNLGELYAAYQNRFIGECELCLAHLFDYFLCAHARFYFYAICSLETTI